MRIILVAVLTLAALVQCGIFGLASISQTMSAVWPETAAEFVDGWQRIRVPLLWDPIGQTLLALPLALVLTLIATALWVGRWRPSAR